MKKFLAMLLAAAMVMALAACGSSDTQSSDAGTTPAATEGQSADSTSTEAQAEAWKPTKSVSAEIGYGAGGSTDAALRPLFSVAEKEMGQTIVVNNVTGASASISFNAALQQPADGYTLVIGAETPALYDAYDLIPETYDDTEIIMVVANTDNCIFVSKDSPYQTFTEMVEAEKANPGTVLKVASGKVGASANISAVIKAVAGVSFEEYTSDGSGTTVTSVMGGFADWGLASFTSLKDYIASGDVRVLCSASSERVKEEYPCITEEYPDMAKYLPMNAFYAITVKKGTDQAIIDYYTELFTKAYNSDTYQETLANMGLNPLGLTGEEAAKFVHDYRLNAITVLYETGAITHSPEELGLK